MTGEVDHRGTPVLQLIIGGEEWTAVIDTGFDGFLQLPESLTDEFPGKYWGEAEVALGGGQIVQEDLFTIAFPFDNDILSGEASFTPGDEILIGTGLLQGYRLEIDFVARTVLLVKATMP